MTRLLIGVLCVALTAGAVSAIAADDAPGPSAQLAKKKCKKKKAHSAKKKKCKKKLTKLPPVAPPVTTPQTSTGSTTTTPPPADADGDGVPDSTDNCIDDPNPSQEDVDADDRGNVCDNCTDDANPGQEDADADGHGDVCDACPDTSNPGTAPCPAQIDHMNVQSPICVGSNPAGGSVVLTAPATADTVVSLLSSDTNVATVPATVTVPMGQDIGSFDITGLQAGNVDITATLGLDQVVQSRSVEAC